MWYINPRQHIIPSAPYILSQLRQIDFHSGCLSNVCILLTGHEISSLHSPVSTFSGKNQLILTKKRAFMKKINLCHLNSVRIGVVLFVGVGLFLSKATFAQGSGKTSLPTITSFVITPTTTTVKGVLRDWNEFSWKTANADRVRLYKDGKELKGRDQLSNGEFGWPLSLKGGLKIQRKRPALYKLVAENSNGKASKTLGVKLKGNGSPTAPVLPEILAFKITPQTGRPGDVVQFYWQTKGAQQVRLFDDVGEIMSRIELTNGRYGWPLAMNNEMQESLNKSTTYKLVATSKAGSVSKSFKVTVVEKSCPVIVSITGKYGKHTDAVGVFQVKSGSTDKFLFKRPVNTVRDHRKGKNTTPYQKSNITLPPGKYSLVPTGGGKDKNGYFGVLYKPGKSKFICRNGNSGNISFKSDYAEY